MKILLFALLALASNLGAHEDHHHHHEDKNTQSLAAHVHGEAKISIVASENEVFISWEAPGESILGFERVPKSAEEKMLWNNLKEEWSKNLLNSFEVQDLTCEMSESKMEMNNQEKQTTSHSHIYGQVHLKCDKPTKNQIINIELKKRFKRIKKLTIEVLPSHKAPYTEVLKGDQNTVELSL